MVSTTSTSPIIVGNTGYVGFFSLNGSNVPTAPDSTPTGALYTGPNMAAATDMGVTVTVTAITGVTGGYVASFSTSSGFTAGTVYHLRLTWVISSTTYRMFVSVMAS